MRIDNDRRRYAPWTIRTDYDPTEILLIITSLLGRWQAADFFRRLALFGKLDLAGLNGRDYTHLQRLNSTRR